jgi:lipopolysaccharide biosynthesis regulator YciM
VSTILVVIAIAACLAVYALLRRRWRKAPSGSLYVSALEKLLEGRSEEGFAELKREVSGDPGNTGAYLLLGDLLRDRGECERAARLHQQLLVRPGLDREMGTEIRLHLAKDLEAAGKWQAAEAVYREIAGQAEGVAQGREGLARALEKQGKWQEALGIRQRIKDTPASVTALILARMGQEELKHGRLKEARARLLEALKKDRGCMVAKLLMGDSYLREGKLDEAVAQWRAVLLEDHRLAREAFSRLEDALFEGGRFGEMERVYRDAIERRPDDSSVVWAMAGFLARKGEKGEAIDLCRSHLGRHPEDREVRLKLALLSRDVGDTEEALANLLKLAPAEDQRVSYACPACGQQAEELTWLCPSCDRWVLFCATR